MKKRYTLLALLFCLIGSSPAYAQYKQSDEPLTVITAEQKVVLQNGRDASMATSYLKWAETAGTTLADFFTKKVDDSSILMFKDAGEGLFYLYNPSHTSYVEDPSFGYASDFKLHWTTDISKAAKLAPSDEIMAADQSTPALYFLNTTEVMGISSWYLTAASPYARGAAGYTNLHFESSAHLNAWVVYAVEEEGGIGMLENILSNQFPAGVSEEVFAVGTNPGCISPSAYDALYYAYTEALAAYDARNKTADEYQSLAEALLEAYNNAMASLVQVTPGYYFIRNYAVDSYVYAHDTQDGTNFNIRARWAYYELPDTYESAMAPYIWQVIPSESGTGYNLYNPFFDKYISYSGSYGVSTPLNQSIENAGTFIVNYQDASYAQQGGYFNILNSNYGGRVMRAISGENGVGYSSSSTDPKEEDAMWQFIPVPDAFIAAMEADKNKEKLVSDMQKLVDSSNELLAKTKVYDSPVVINGIIDTPGLITNLTTNAQENLEGDAAYAIDSDVSTFFHTSWSAGSPHPDEGYHNFCVSLSEPVQELALKIVKRTASNGISQGSPYHPAKIIVYAENAANGEDSIGVIKPIYDQGFLPFEGSTELAENMVSVSYLKLPYATSRLRFDVAKNAGNDEPYFTFSEVGVYKATYNATASPYENIPTDVRETFATTLAKAEQEMDQNAPTKETYDQLQQAYQAMNDAFVDRSELRKLLEEARTYADEAIEDAEELGYYSFGSVDGYNTALDAVEQRINDTTNPSPEEFESIKSDIDKAMSDFDSQLNKPDGSQLYYIQSASAEGDNYDRYLFVSSNDIALVQITMNTVSDPGAFLSYMWHFEPQADGTYYVRNAGNGLYLGGVDRSTNVTSSFDPVPLKVVSSRTPGGLSLQTTEGKNIFTLDYQQGVTLREGTKGPDGAAFTFMPADFQGTHTTKAAPGMQIVTLPFAVLSHINGGVAYYLAGKKQTPEGEAAQLVPYADNTVIPAATPFILVGDDDADETIYITEEEYDGTAIAYVLTPGTSMGLIGTLSSVTVYPPYGVFRNGKIDLALGSGQTINPNSGYFDVSTLEETTVTGAIQLLLTDAVSGIEGLTFDQQSGNAIYDMQGRRISRIQKGGIYIIGGRKVMVK